MEVVAKWARKWKLKLNATKSEVSFFTTSSREAQWIPNILVEGETIKYEKTPRFLGVKLDRDLFFGPHAEEVASKMARKQRIIGAVANTDWGWKKEYLVRLYTALIDSIPKYAGFAWLPCAKKSHVARVAIAQNKALRRVTGQYMATPVEALRLECGLPGLDTEIKRLVALSAEKAVRLPADHPRSLAYHAPGRSRLKRDDWRKVAKDLQNRLPAELQPRVDLQLFAVKPWVEAASMEVSPLLEGVSSRLDREEIRRTAALDNIRQTNASKVIYTDGSATAGTRMGGAAFVVTEGDPESPNVLSSVEKKGALYTCSYEEEVEAMKMAATWIDQHCEREESIQICTDSQSLCMALQSYNPETDPIRETLQGHRGPIHIQWIPGHSNIPGNERADAAAKSAAEMLGPGRAITLRSAKMQIWKTFQDEITHKVMAQVYSGYDKEKEQMANRKDQVTLAQIRSGKHRAFRAYQKLLDDSVDDVCPKCQEEPHTLEHWWLRCPGTLAAKMELFGGGDGQGLSQLTKEPRKALALARSTLLGAGLTAAQ